MTVENNSSTSEMIAQHVSRLSQGAMSAALRPLVSFETSSAPRPDAMYQSDIRRAIASVTPSANGELCNKSPYFGGDESLPSAEKRRIQTIAKAICFVCPKKNPCLIDALADEKIDGIRGGTTSRQRTYMRKKAN